MENGFILSLSTMNVRETLKKQTHLMKMYLHITRESNFNPGNVDRLGPENLGKFEKEFSIYSVLLFLAAVLLWKDLGFLIHVKRLLLNVFYAKEEKNI
jgi:hypothetical protein